MGGMGSGSEVDLPPSGAPSESDFSRVSSQPQSQGASQSGAASDFSVVSHSQARPYLGTTSSQGEGGGGDESRLDALASMYQRHSTATDIRMHVVPPKSQQTGTGRGTLIMPGWVRERAAEVLFEGGDVDEASIAEVILDALLKVPIDLRRLMAASIVLTGGTAMLPGFIPRLHAELLKAMDPPPHSTKQPTRYVSGRRNPPPVPSYDRYAPLRPLVSYFAILNNPAPPTSETSAATKAGKTPAFAPASLAWVGGSLAGYV
jgi:actin-related protein 10